MKKLRKVLSVISAVAMLVTTYNINIYASDEQTSPDDMILTSSEIHSIDFETTTDSDIAEWNRNYYHDAEQHFRTYFDSATVEDALYSSDAGKAMYICKGKSTYSERAMQYIVADENNETIRQGAYFLNFDYYPAKGTNRISLVSDSEVIEGMATFKSGSTLMSKSFTSASSRKWLTVNIMVDLDNDKATITVDDKETSENVHTNEITYSKDDLRVINFYMSGTTICTAANAAIIDNISFNKLVVKPEIKFSIIDKENNEKTDFSEVFTSVESIKIDFGMEMNPDTLNCENVLLINKTTEQPVDYNFEYLSGGVYVMTPKSYLDEITDYEIVVTDAVQYSTEFGDDKFAAETRAEFKTGDSRVNPVISFILSDGLEETDFSDVACSISQIKIDFLADMEEDSFTDESLKLIDVESNEEVPYDGEYIDGEGIYRITPRGSFADGKTYSLELSEQIKYLSGREILEYSYAFTIPAYDYYRQDFNGMLYSTIDTWSGAKSDNSVVLNDFASSPVVPHYGASTWPNIGYDGTDALYLAICKDGAYYAGDGNYGTFTFANDYPNRNVDIPVSKKLESSGIYSLTCDYYPSNGTESFILRGNQKFPDGYNTDNGSRIGNFGFEPKGYTREWCTLNITVDLDENVASVKITTKESGEVVYEVESSYTQQLGVIVIYMEGPSISSRANSAIVDNIEIKRQTATGPVFKDKDIQYYAGNVLQSDKDNINYLTDRIEITPEHDIKMSSITSENLYITEGLNNKIDCRIRYSDGKINLYPVETLKNYTAYVVHIENLCNLDGYTMSGSFDQTFMTGLSKMEISILPEQDKWLETIAENNKFTVSFSAVNSGNKEKKVYFVAAYYNEDYSKLIGMDCVEKLFSEREAVNDGMVEFTLPSDTKNIQVSVMESFGKMTQICKAIDLKIS